MRRDDDDDDDCDEDYTITTDNLYNTYADADDYFAATMAMAIGRLWSKPKWFAGSRSKNIKVVARTAEWSQEHLLWEASLLRK